MKLTKKVELKCSHQNMRVVTNVLISWMGGILPQCVPISNHHKVRLKYLTILFVNYTSVKPKHSSPH